MLRGYCVPGMALDTGAHQGKNRAAWRQTPCPEEFGSGVEMGNQKRPKMWLSPLPAAGVQSPRTPQLQILLQRVPSLQGRPKADRGVSSDAALGFRDCRACVGLPGGWPGWAQPSLAILSSQESTAWSWGTASGMHAAWQCGSLHRWLGLGLNLARPPPGEMLPEFIYPFPQHPRVSESTRRRREPLQLVLCWLLFSTGLWVDGKVTRSGIKANNGLRVQREGRDLVVGFLPSLIVFILKMIPNSWARDHLACVPGAARG